MVKLSWNYFLENLISVTGNIVFGILFIAISGWSVRIISASDFQSEVGEVFGEIGGELPAKFGRRFSSFFCWGNRQKHFPPKLHRKFHHQTSLRGFRVVAGPRIIPNSSQGSAFIIICCREGFRGGLVPKRPSLLLGGGGSWRTPKG